MSYFVQPDQVNRSHISQQINPETNIPTAYALFLVHGLDESERGLCGNDGLDKNEKKGVIVIPRSFPFNYMYVKL
jgi:hypothetical protein